MANRPDTVGAEAQAIEICIRSGPDLRIPA